MLRPTWLVAMTFFAALLPSLTTPLLSASEAASSSSAARVSDWKRYGEKLLDWDEQVPCMVCSKSFARGSGLVFHNPCNAPYCGGCVALALHEEGWCLGCDDIPLQMFRLSPLRTTEKCEACDEDENVEARYFKDRGRFCKDCYNQSKDKRRRDSASDEMDFAGHRF